MICDLRMIRDFYSSAGESGRRSYEKSVQAGSIYNIM